MWRREKWGQSDFFGQKFGQTGKKIPNLRQARNFEICEHLEAHLGSSFGEVGSAILQNSQRAK
jgi:hypothetical protein